MPFDHEEARKLVAAAIAAGTIKMAPEKSLQSGPNHAQEPRVGVPAKDKPWRNPPGAAGRWKAGGGKGVSPNKRDQRVIARMNRQPTIRDVQLALHRVDAVKRRINMLEESLAGHRDTLVRLESELKETTHRFQNPKYPVLEVIQG